jgi:hypothetical protein
MMTALILTLAAVTTATRPEIVTPAPVTHGAQLLQALQQAEDDFASVQRNLGLVGTAPLAGLGAEKASNRPSASRASKARAQKVAIKTQH